MQEESGLLHPVENHHIGTPKEGQDGNGRGPVAFLARRFTWIIALCYGIVMMCLAHGQGGIRG